MLAYENASEDYKWAMRPVKETGDINSYMKVCRDVLSNSRKTQLFAETMATTYHNLQKENKNSKDLKCFGCEQTGHLKKILDKKKCLLDKI